MFFLLINLKVRGHCTVSQNCNVTIEFLNKKLSWKCVSVRTFPFEITLGHNFQFNRSERSYNAKSVFQL